MDSIFRRPNHPRHFLQAYADALQRKDRALAEALFRQAAAEYSRLNKRYQDLEKLGSSKRKRSALYPMQADVLSRLNSAGYESWAIGKMRRANDGIIPSREDYAALCRKAAEEHAASMQQQLNFVGG